MAAAAQKPKEPTPEELEAQKDARLAELEDEIAGLRAQLAASANGAAEAGGTENVLARLTVALENLGQTRAAAPGSGTFGRGETPEQILASLHGTVSVGEHSGVYNDGSDEGTTDAALAIPVTFISKGANFNVIRKSRIRIVDVDGSPRTSEGVHYNFAPNGTFVTDDLSVIRYLRTRPTYNVEFVERGRELDRAGGPDDEPVLRQIAQATVELDDERLAAIQAEETDGHRRDSVLKAVASARRVVRGMAEQED